MRRFTIAVAVLTLAACAPKEQPADTTATATPPAPTIALSDVAGTWTASVTQQNSDSVILTYDLTASADPTAWTITLLGRPPIAVRPTVDGDSIITEAGPYESALRKGVQVTTSGVMRLVDGQLVGTTTARYQTTGADSVVTLRTRATKKM